MYIVNGIAYADNDADNVEVQAIKLLGDMMMLVTFASGEMRLFDGTKLLQYPAFKPLVNEELFKAAKVEHGVVTWCDGEIDISPDTMYKESYAYSDESYTNLISAS